MNICNELLTLFTQKKIYVFFVVLKKVLSQNGGAACISADSEVLSDERLLWRVFSHSQPVFLCRLSKTRCERLALLRGIQRDVCRPPTGFMPFAVSPRCVVVN